MALRHFVSALALFVLAGCSTGSALLTGTARDPIDPSGVKIYRFEPSVHFEYVGIVKSEAESLFSQQDALNRATEELKKQAAKMGANGIILDKIGEKQEPYTSYTADEDGVVTFDSSTNEYQTLQGDAIYVFEGH